MPKMNFIIHFFLEILHFEESCSLIGLQYFGLQLKNQNLDRYGIDGEILIKILVFILDYFQEKLITKFTLEQFGALFPKIEVKMNFTGKKGCLILNIPIIYHCAESQKKTNDPFLRKMLN